MDLTEACFHLRHRRGMYLMDGRYETVVAFVIGLSSASDGRLLDGFNEFVANRVLGHRTTRGWWSLVRNGVDRTAPLDDEAAVALLLELLEEFAAGGLDRASAPRPESGRLVHGVVVAQHPWGLEIALEEQGALATIDLRFLSDDAADMNADRFPPLGTRITARVQGTMPDGQLRLTTRSSDLAGPENTA